jgi:CDP-diacylglycerol--serine O-phosphatidyltransferase
MEKIYGFLIYVLKFVTDPDFQWSLLWVRKVSGGVSAIFSPNALTTSRFFGGVVSVLIGYYNPWLGILSFLLFGLTDWFDGKVVRYREELNIGWEHNKRFGAILDGMADKVYIVPAMWDWGKDFLSHTLIAIYVCIAFTGYVIIAFINWRRGGDKTGNIYEHLWIGKMKFALQIILVCALWVATNFAPQWIWWPFWTNLMLGIITGLEFFSVARKINPEFNRFSADAVSLGNLIYGGISIYYSWHKNFNMAGAAIIVGAIFDLADGYVARRTKGIESKIGSLIDSCTDFISFGLAPASILYFAGVRWELALMYAAGTLGRLIYFYLRSEEEGMFDGVPSTAVAVFIASLFLWKNPPAAHLEIVAVCCVALEVFFIFQWYHFRKIVECRVEIKVALGILLAASLVGGFFGKTVSVLFFGYLLFFFRPVADWSWRRNKIQGGISQ